MNGNHTHVDFLRDFDNGSEKTKSVSRFPTSHLADFFGSTTVPPTLNDPMHVSRLNRRAKIRELFSQPNYDDYLKPFVSMDTFDMAIAQRRLAAALGSAASVRTGAKAYHIPFTQDHDEISANSGPLRKTEERHRLYDGQGGFWQETKNSGRDRSSQAVCAFCGKPGPVLALCSGCRVVRYCSRPHQKVRRKDMLCLQCAAKVANVDTDRNIGERTRQTAVLHRRPRKRSRHPNHQLILHFRPILWGLKLVLSRVI